MSDVKKCKNIAQTPIINTEFGACKEAFAECKKTEDAVGPAALKCCEGTGTVSTTGPGSNSTGGTGSTKSTRFRRKLSFNLNKFKL